MKSTNQQKKIKFHRQTWKIVQMIPLRLKDSIIYSFLISLRILALIAVNSNMDHKLLKKWGFLKLILDYQHEAKFIGQYLSWFLYLWKIIRSDKYRNQIQEGPIGVLPALHDRQVFDGASYCIQNGSIGPQT